VNVQDRFRFRYLGPQGIIEGIRVCLSHDHTASALGLICAAVESMAFLSLPEGRETLHDSDFISWADSYLRPYRIGVSGEDLWKIRSALLSRRIPQRRSTSTGGKPREILFAWGGYIVYSAMELRPGSLWHRVMTIHADELYKAVLRGAEEFCADYVGKPENAYLVDMRLNQVFGSER